MAEIKKYRSANIEVVANGFVVHIGCQTVVAETPTKLIELISDYLKDPEVAEKKLMQNSMAQGEIPSPMDGPLIRDQIINRRFGTAFGTAAGTASINSTL